MKKRPTLKGKGIDVFLGKEMKSPVPEKDIISEKEKGTFYLPPSLLDSLDSVWLILRKNNRKIRKSDVVKFALEDALSRFEKEGKNSLLFKHFISQTL